MGKDAIMKKEMDLIPEDVNEKDLLISLGIFIKILHFNI